MSFVSLDVDVVDVAAGNVNHCCCNVFGDLVNGDDDSSYLEELLGISQNSKKLKHKVSQRM